MKTEVKIKYKPWAKQKIFHDSDKKFRAFVGGLGSGKSVAGAIEAIKTMVNCPGSMGAILAPTYPLLRDSTIKTFFDFLPRELIKSYSKQEQKVILINNSEAIFRPCDDETTIDRLRNINLGWVWIDEAGLVPEYAFRVTIGRMRHLKGPLKFWLTTTPRGKNWIFDRWLDKPTEDYFLVQAKTRENPYLPKEYIDTLVGEYVGIFAKQELEGEFVGLEGVVYPAFSRNTHIIDTKDIEIKEHKYGVDFGFSNPSVIIDIGFDYDGRAYILKEFYQKHITDAQLAEIAKKDYGSEYPYILDSANPSGIQEFRNIGLTCFPAEKISGERETSSILAGIKKVSTYLETQQDGKPRLFIDKKCLNTIMEFENYRFPDTKDGKPVQETPIKVHDHIMDALRYSLTLGNMEMEVIEDFDKLLDAL